MTGMCFLSALPQTSSPIKTPAASPNTNQLIKLLITLLIAYRQREGRLGNQTQKPSRGPALTILTNKEDACQAKHTHTPQIPCSHDWKKNKSGYNAKLPCSPSVTELVMSHPVTWMTITWQKDENVNECVSLLVSVYHLWEYTLNNFVSQFTYQKDCLHPSKCVQHTVS